MKQGQIIQQGTHEELFNDQSGPYVQLLEEVV